MSWGSRRKAIIVLILASIALALAAVTLVAVLYETPSCTDGKQNQDEAGVDCGGSCAYLCRAGLQEPIVRFTRFLPTSTGKTAVISYLDNPNASAAIENARYSITLYDVDGIVVGTRMGVIDLPPAATVPVFVPDFATGYRTVARAFLELDADSIKWFRPKTTQPVLTVSALHYVPGNEPRVTATIGNPSPDPVYDVEVVATLFANNNAIASSRTVVDVPGAGSAPVVFTWNEPLPETPTRTEVIPIIPLR